MMDHFINRDVYIDYDISHMTVGAISVNFVLPYRGDHVDICNSYFFYNEDENYDDVKKVINTSFINTYIDHCFVRYQEHATLNEINFKINNIPIPRESEMKSGDYSVGSGIRRYVLIHILYKEFGDLYFDYRKRTIRRIKNILNSEKLKKDVQSSRESWEMSRLRNTIYDLNVSNLSDEDVKSVLDEIRCRKVIESLRNVSFLGVENS